MISGWAASHASTVPLSRSSYETALRDVTAKGWWIPVARQEAVAPVRVAFDASARRACAILRFSHVFVRYRSRDEDADDVRERLLALKGEQPRFGWQRPLVLLAGEAMVPKHKQSSESVGG